MILHKDYFICCPHCGAHHHSPELSIIHANLICCGVCCKLFSYAVSDLHEEQNDHRQLMEKLLEYEQKRALKQLKWIMVTCLVIAIIVAWLIIE